MSADSAPIFDSAASRTREQKPLAVGTIRGALPRSLVRVGPCAHANAARAHNAPVGTGDGSRITSDAGCRMPAEPLINRVPDNGTEKRGRFTGLR
jgi:hypothetical protein